MSDTDGCRLRFDLQYWWCRPSKWLYVLSQRRFYGGRRGILRLIVQDTRYPRQMWEGDKVLTEPKTHADRLLRLAGQEKDCPNKAFHPGDPQCALPVGVCPDCKGEASFTGTSKVARFQALRRKCPNMGVKPWWPGNKDNHELEGINCVCQGRRWVVVDTEGALLDAIFSEFQHIALGKLELRQEFTCRITAIGPEDTGKWTDWEKTLKEALSLALYRTAQEEADNVR
mgnify:CR=1 FL=1